VSYGWRRQLALSGAVSHDEIYQLGSLSAFAQEGPQLAEQMLTPARAVLDLPNAAIEPLMTRPQFLRLDDDVISECSTLILRFAGGPAKWLPADLVIEWLFS
jgi:hypothetical protein